jgi:hypothetical protein
MSAARIITAHDGRSLGPELAARAGDVGWMALAFVVGGLAVGGTMTLLWVTGDLPPGVGLVGFLLSGRAPGLDPMDTTAFWWMLFALVVIVAAAAAWVWSGQFVIYLSLRNLRALPPLIVGGPARCHLCGDALPPEGLVRRCKSCKADNLVDGVHFRQAAATFDDAIQRAERAARDAVGRRIARLENGVMWAAAMPFILLVVMPVSLLLDGPHVELLWLPPTIFAFGFVLRVLGAFVRPRGPRGPRSAGARG